MKKLIALTVMSAFVATSNNAMALTKKRRIKKSNTTQSSSTNSNSSVEQQVSSKQSAITEAGTPKDNSAKSSFSAKYYADLSTARNARDDFDANAVNGYSFLQELGASYAFTTVDSLSLTTRVIAVKNTVLQEDGTYAKSEGFVSDRTYLNYTRSSILTEKDHGLDLAAMMHVRYLSDATRREGADGMVRPGLSLTKTFDKFSTNVGFYRAQYVRSKDSQTSDFYNYVTLMPTYQFTDSLSASLLVEYIKSYRINGTATESTDVAALLDYTFTPTIAGELYLDNDYTMISGDGGDLFQKDWTKQINVGAALTIKIF